MKKISTILFFFLCTCATIFAQEFSVISFEEKPFDMTANDERYKLIDGNGDTFSIIKLLAGTPNDDLSAYSFDFGMCEGCQKVVDGEVWWYVQRNAMHATIKRDGYKTVKYELNVTVQPGKVYEMILQATPRVAKKRYVLFKVQPADSKALVLLKADGENEYRPFGAGLVNEDGMLSNKLVLGRYSYKITSQNYYPSEGVIELIDGQGAFAETVTLRPNFGTVMLTAEEGSEIFVDGESLGFGTWTGILAPGFYDVECRKQNHRNSIESIEVQEGVVVTVKLKSPQPITGALDITSEPLDASIIIDGKDCGNTPDVIDGIMIGTHKVTLSKNGYSTVTLDVEIKESETTEHIVALEKIAVNNNCQTSKTTTSGTINGHEYVDLGLSVKWATCNVGANNPWEDGGYYAWGETEEKSDYDFKTYKWRRGSYGNMTKYCTDRDDGRVDNKTILDPEDDVAHVKWGGTWRMPTKVEQDELLNNCTWSWTTKNGVEGYSVTGPNGNSIFLPAAGFHYGWKRDINRGRWGYYWSSSLYSNGSDYAYILSFNNFKLECLGESRSSGLSVRPVSE